MIHAHHRFFRLVAASFIAAAFVLTPVQRDVAARAAFPTPTWLAAPPASIAAPHGADAITATASLTAVATATQGQTNVVLPLQVTSGHVLVVTVQTRARARVSFTVAYPDGTMRHIVRIATALGTTRFAPVVAYQPQGAAETAAVTIAVYYNKRRFGEPDDLVTRNVTVLQRIVLSGSLDVPPFVVVGTTLPLTVSTNLPNVAVHAILVYPNGRPQSSPGYDTGVDGTVLFSLPVSSSDGRRGLLRVQVILRYGGAERILRRLVHLRPPAGFGR